jgi:long-subunit acyl-CoA synthetase (AMP-forming)
MAELFDHACAQYANEPCMGSRPIVRMRVEDKVEKYVLGPYSMITYAEAHDVASQFGRGLAGLGVSSGQMVNFFADTCQECVRAGPRFAALTACRYQLAIQGCFQQGVVVSTTYANLGEDAVAYAIQQAEVSVVFTDAQLAVSVIARVLQDCPKVRHVVFVSDRRTCTHASYVPDGAVQAKMPKHVKAHSFAQVCLAGSAAEPKPRPAGASLA